MTPPILGIFASAVTGGVSTNSFESIATVSVGSGGSSSVEFASIPNTYQHLQLRLIARETASVTNDYMNMRFNNNSTGTKYNIQQAIADGTTVSAGVFYSQNQYYAQRITGASASANMFGGAIIDIADYKNTNKFKSLTLLGGNNRNGSGLFYLTTGYWADTSAIDTITITPGSGNFVQYSHFALYGIKAAA